MTVDFVPRSHLADHFRKGWRLIPGHSYQQGDWAVLLWLPEHVTPVSEDVIESWCRRFAKPVHAPRYTSNLSAGRASEMSTRRRLREAA